jgi:1-deoxy-D-xylulose-5-phosphate reductoisomerase
LWGSLDQSVDGCCVPVSASSGPIRSERRRVAVLGSTGSIGSNCMEVIEHLSDRLEVLGLSAHNSWPRLFEQAARHKPRWLVLTDPKAAKQAETIRLPGGTKFLAGTDGIVAMVTDPEVDIVVVAVVGAAGLAGTWAALEHGKTVAIANKETLVMAGPLVKELAREKGAAVLPVDSEHSAVFQAMQAGRPAEVERIVLTGSGGPFRGRRAAELAEVAIADALKHPTWRMGPKITVDSATLMNKALEVIEAHWLFDLPPERIDVLIHPESIVHSFVEFADGAILAQLSPPDMRLPIQYALTYPERVPGPARRLAWREMTSWHFEAPDRDTFPALELGYEAARGGGTCGAVLSAANEAAVSRFLAGELAFLDIPRACRDVLEHHPFSARPTMSELMAVDRWARQEVNRWKHPMHPNGNRI